MEASSSGTSETERQPCSICLAPISDEAYLDRCFHSFCYKCIGEWLSFVAAKSSKPLSSFVCPLCKGQNSSIIHSVYGRSFQRHYASKDNIKRPLSDAHMLRLHVYNTNQDIGHNRADVVQYWKKCKYLQKNMWLQNWLRRDIQAILQARQRSIWY
ncbi:E3 ubiquitin-protein ligase Topors [Rhynchospora pubera]|uniref:E3 ubiquitin-protein ligase Topors n=1 Tax=Rhynchospora pubera TaxID=906938 RepID=A0AAV8FTJ8_9POAL|nr:E3 ubiquitin-protein ligase Topors [Rhynchospora pubera]